MTSPGSLLGSDKPGQDAGLIAKSDKLFCCQSAPEVGDRFSTGGTSPPVLTFSTNSHCPPPRGTADTPRFLQPVLLHPQHPPSIPPASPQQPVPDAARGLLSRMLAPLPPNPRASPLDSAMLFPKLISATGPCSLNPP